MTEYEKNKKSLDYFYRGEIEIDSLLDIIHLMAINISNEDYAQIISNFHSEKLRTIRADFAIIVLIGTLRVFAEAMNKIIAERSST